MRTGRLLPSQRHPLSSAWGTSAVTLAALAAVIWIAQFLHASGFGLYKDDYARIPLMIGIGGREFAARLWESATHPAGGLPLHGPLIYAFAFLGERIGSLWGCYLLAFLIDLANAWVFYLIVRRVLDREAVALAAALAFALFPGDSTRTWLTSAYALQISSLFLLIAIYLYLHGRRIAPYALIALTLLTYEAVFPVFFAAPLLGERRAGNLRRELVRHGAILAAMLGALVLIRIATGERRFAHLSIGHAAAVVLRNMAEGPIVALGSYLLRPLRALPGLTTFELLLLLASFGLMLGALSLLAARPVVAGARSAPVAPARDADADLEPGRRLLRLGGTGLVMLVLAYAVTVLGNFRDLSVGTRVNLAAAFGAALIIACVIAGALRLARSRRARQLLIVGLAGGLTIVMGARFPIQRDYVASWRQQGQFWAELLALVPDLDEGVRILVVAEGLPQTRFAPGVGWEDYDTFNQLLHFLPSWRDPPRVFNVSKAVAAAPDADGWFHLDPDEFGWARAEELAFPASRAIVVEYQGGKLTRRTGRRQAASAERPPLPIEKGVLFDLLIREPSAQILQEVDASAKPDPGQAR